MMLFNKMPLLMLASSHRRRFGRGIMRGSSGLKAGGEEKGGKWEADFFPQTDEEIRRWEALPDVWDNIWGGYELWTSADDDAKKKAAAELWELAGRGTFRNLSRRDELPEVDIEDALRTVVGPLDDPENTYNRAMSCIERTAELCRRAGRFNEGALWVLDDLDGEVCIFKSGSPSALVELVRSGGGDLKIEAATTIRTLLCLDFLRLDLPGSTADALLDMLRDGTLEEERKVARSVLQLIKFGTSSPNLKLLAAQLNLPSNATEDDIDRALRSSFT